MLVKHLAHNEWLVGVSYYFDHSLAGVQDMECVNHAIAVIWMFIRSMKEEEFREGGNRL